MPAIGWKLLVMRDDSDFENIHASYCRSGAIIHYRAGFLQEITDQAVLESATPACAGRSACRRRGEYWLAGGAVLNKAGWRWNRAAINGE